MKKHGWISCEASLQGFENADLLDQLSPMMQRALKIYDILKTKCLKEGHTWMKNYTMKNQYDAEFGKFPKGNELKETLDELEKRGVLEVEEKYAFCFLSFLSFFSIFNKY